MKGIARLAVLLVLSGCSTFDREPPMQGEVEAGVYVHPSGHFRCPVPGLDMGFNPENLRVIDGWRDRHWEPDPFSTDPLFKQRLVTNGIKIDGGVTFRDGPHVGFAAKLEVSPGGMRHSHDDTLRTFFGGGFAKPLDTVHYTSVHGDAAYRLMMVPWFDPELSYMGANLLAAHMADETKGPPSLVAKINVIQGRTHYHVGWEIGAGPHLPQGMNVRDLPQVFQYLEDHPELMTRMRQTMTSWFDSCVVTDFVASEPGAP